VYTLNQKDIRIIVRLVLTANNMKAKNIIAYAQANQGSPLGDNGFGQPTTRDCPYI